MSDMLKDTQQVRGRGRIRNAVLPKIQRGLFSLHRCKLQGLWATEGSSAEEGSGTQALG